MHGIMRRGRRRSGDRRYAAVVGRGDNGYWVAFADLPGRVFRGESLPQAVAAACEAFARDLDARRLVGWSPPPSSPLGCVPDWLESMVERRDLVHLLLDV